MARTMGVTALLLVTMTGCAVTIPTDPDGTLDRVTGGTLRVGVSPNPPWTDLPRGTEDDPEGTEVRLVEAFADTLQADVEWVPGGEENLIGQLERGELDLVIGGLTAQSPWSEKVAMTYRYTETTGPEGEKELHVMAVPMGENAFLVELESFLLEADR